MHAVLRLKLSCVNMLSSLEKDHVLYRCLVYRALPIQSTDSLQLYLSAPQSSDVVAAAGDGGLAVAADAAATVPLEPLGWMPPDLLIQAIDSLCSVTGAVLADNSLRCLVMQHTALTLKVAAVITPIGCTVHIPCYTYAI
jgi:hypothetical protein